MLTDMIILSKNGKPEAQIPFIQYICMDCFQRQAVMEIQFNLDRKWGMEEVETLHPICISHIPLG